MRERTTFVVMVRRSELSQDVIGPYRSFRAAEGDAKAWGGTVHPVIKCRAYNPPSLNTKNEGEQQHASN